MSLFQNIRSVLDIFQSRYRFLILVVAILAPLTAAFAVAGLFGVEKFALGFAIVAGGVGLIAIRDVARGNGRAIFSRCHMFISSPSASMKNDDARTSWTEQLAHVQDTIEKQIGVTHIACPTITHPVAEDQEKPKDALNTNLQQIRDADYFVAVIPQWGHAKGAPTSSLIEIGIAIAYGKKIAIFMQSDLKLPYIIGDVDGVLGRNLKPISVKTYETYEDIVSDISQHRLDIFA